MKQEALGFTLIEVLVAVVVLSLGLLGLASLQAWGVRNTGNALYRTQATLIANDLVERMRANVPGALAGAYESEPGTAGSCQSTTADCSTAALAQADLAEIGEEILRLPQGALLTDCAAGAAVCAVTVSWQEVNDSDRWLSDAPTEADKQARTMNVVVRFVP